MAKRFRAIMFLQMTFKRKLKNLGYGQQIDRDPREWFYKKRIRYTATPFVQMSSDIIEGRAKQTVLKFLTKMKDSAQFLIA